MNTRHMNQKGFSHVAVLLLVLFVAVAGLAGYKVVTMNKTAGSTSGDSAAVVVPKVPAVLTSKADLTTASKALDGAGTQVSNSLNDNELNGDLNDLL